MVDAPAFDPDQPFEEVKAPPFDPNKPFEEIGAAAPPTLPGRPAREGLTPEALPEDPFERAALRQRRSVVGHTPPAELTYPERIASNVPHSAAEFGKSIAQTVMHPVQTAEDLAAIGGGVMQHLGMMEGDKYKPYANAVGEMLMKRYGSLEAIKHTLENDPVGMAADVSMVLTGVGGGVARIPGIAGRVGEAAVTAGRAIDPLSAVSRPVAAAAPYVGRAAAEVAGYVPNVGGRAIQEAAAAGYEGGERAAAFQRHAMGRGEMAEPVHMALGAMRELTERRGQAYRNAIRGIAADTTPLDFGQIDSALARADQINTYGGASLSEGTRAIRNQVNNIVENWRALATYGTADFSPNFFRTPLGLDALKRKIWNEVHPTGQVGSSQYRVENMVKMDAFNAVRQTIIDQAPEYARIMRAYETAETELGELSRELSLPRSEQQPVRIGTSLRKLQAALRNNVSSAYGHREQLAQYLVDNGAPHLMAALAGQALHTPIPRGLGKLGQQVGLEMAALLGIGLHAQGVPSLGTLAASAALLPAGSPWLVGQGAYWGGRGAAGARELGRYVPPLTGLGRPAAAMGRFEQARPFGFKHGGAVKLRVDRTHDVPYLAGARKDGKAIYIDRRLPRTLKVGSKTIDPAKYLAVHEENEWRAMQRGMSYEEAHRKVATPAERAAVEKDGIDWNEYEHELDGYIRETERERVKKSPQGLYLKPYSMRVQQALRTHASDGKRADGGKVKRTQASVHYKDNRGTLPRHCGNCSMFIKPRGCTEVGGHIMPMGKCDIWAGKKKFQEGGAVGTFDTELTPQGEIDFQKWKQVNAPHDSGADYDLRGAYQAGFSPDPETGHWPDTFKKPNHPTFSDQSIYAAARPEMAGTWRGDQYLPPHIRAAAEQPTTPPPSWNAALGMPEVPAPIVPPRQVAQEKTIPRFVAEQAIPHLITGAVDWAATPGRAYQQGLTPEEETQWGAGTALGMLGMGVGRAASPMGAPRPGEFDLGVFGGRGSKTANKGMLAKAEEMEAAEATPESIWNQTGWVRRADNQWRYEIPDQDAKLHPLKQVELKTDTGKKTIGLEGFGPLKEVIDHPLFDKAYPQFGNIQTEVKIHPSLKERGFTDVRQEPGELTRTPSYIYAQGPDKETVLNVLLHEMQHAVQEHEGFAPGASPRALNLKPSEINKVALRIAKETEGVTPSMWNMLSPFARKHFQELARFDIYERQLGEAEARNVPKRREFEHRQVMPQATEDVPEARQIVGRRLPTGGAELPLKQVYASEPRPGTERIENVHRSPLAFDEPLKAGTEFEAHPGLISTRFPTGVKATEDPLRYRLSIDEAAMQADPNLYRQNVNLLRKYPNLTREQAIGPPEKVAQNFINHVKDNLIWLHNQVPAEIRNRSKLWYDGANRIVNDRAAQYDVSPSSVSGVYAAMSPQKDWFQNVSLGDRVLDTYFNHGSTRFSPEMETAASDMRTAAVNDTRKRGAKRGLSATEIEQNVKDRTQGLDDIFNRIRGKIFDELYGINDPDLQLEARAAWLRLHDEAHRSSEHSIITPEGDQAGLVMGKKGPAGAGWGSLVEIAKALQSLDAKGNVDIISNAMGTRHKVRNFYNNMLHPNAPYGDVTMDTHAVAAALLRPLSGKSVEVAHNFGNYAGKGVPGAASSDISGISGTYGLYADAYRQAAAELGLLPRELQSITWEAARGLFTDTFKSEAKHIAAVNRIWQNHRNGRLTLDQARQAILDYAGGINPPAWYRP